MKTGLVGEAWMTRLGRVMVVVSLAGAAACGRGQDAQAQDNGGAQQRVQQQLGTTPAVIDTSLAGKLSATFRAAASKALPAVVYIRVASRPQVAQRPNFPGLPPGFFGAPDDGSAEPQLATGSGFIYDSRGYIMTNNHVVADATQVTVRLVDGREYAARVVGRDPNTDVAVIQITPRNGETLPTVQLANSDQAQVGDWVVALGNPLGLDFTVTAGIVSAKGRGNLGILRDRQGATALEAYIQTDAAINPGNSGGPLVDLMGRVIGINSAIESPTGYFTGAGFAIPINLASRVAQDLVRFGAVHRPRLGITVGPVGPADAELYGLPSVSGALVKGVQPGTPAASAGLQPGDVVVAIDGQAIRTDIDLTTSLAEKQPGDVVTLALYRNKQRQNVQVRLGQFETTRAPTTPGAARPSSEQLLGLSVVPLTPQIAQQLGVNRTSGVVISGVNPLSGAAGQVGRGQILLSINGQPVRAVGDVERIAATLRPGQIVSLRVFDAQFLHEAPHRLRVTDVLPGPLRVHPLGDAVELEVVHSVVVDHAEASVLECRVIPRAGEGEPGGINFEPLLLAELKPLLAGFAIPAEGRQPHAQMCVELGAEFGQRGEAARKPRMKSP